MRLDKLAPGAQLGPFVLRARLGKGGFAPVWLADEQYGPTTLRQVAVKLFAVGGDLKTNVDADGASSGFRRAHVLDEARALCEVEHPNVVRFYSLYDGDPIIGLIMEHVAGTSVETMLRDATDGTLSVDETLSIGAALASALSAVHQVGLVHRDVKPANVVRAAEHFKLIDFGIASATRAKPRAPTPVIVDGIPLDVGDDEATSSDPSGSSRYGAGSMGYVDPVCFSEASAPTPASDLYSLGVTLYQCITGELPARTTARLAGRDLLDDDTLAGRVRARPLREVKPEIPESVAELIDALLAPKPEDRPRSSEAVAWELERIRRDRAGLQRPLPSEERGPFRGLGRFEAGDRDVYFGRTVEIATAVEMLRSRGLVALIGSSGSGKSSLARAGVLPAIADGALGWPKQWDTVVVSPGADPRAALVAALAPLVPDAAKRSAEALASALAERAQSTGRGTLLLIDQLEEIVTLAEPQGRDYAVQLLTAMGSRPLPGVRVLVTLREDLNAALLGLGQVGGILQRGTLIVAPISDATWQEVIDQALACYRYKLEDKELRAKLLDELQGKASAMPLVQFALTALWERRDKERRVISRADYEAIGGLTGALATHADQTLRAIGSLGPQGYLRARDLLLGMTTAKGTRAAVDPAALAQKFPGDLTKQVLTALEQARLVVREGKKTLTLAHEALIVEWPVLKSWIEERRGERFILEALERDAAEWTDSGQDVERLWKGRRLLNAADIVKRDPDLASPSAVAFVGVSSRKARAQRVLGGAVGAGLLVLAMTVGLLMFNAKKARAERETVERENAAQAELARTQAELREQRRIAAERERTDAALRKAAEEAKRADEAHADSVQAQGVASQATHVADKCKQEQQQIKTLSEQLARAGKKDCADEIATCEEKVRAVTLKWKEAAAGK